MLCGPGDDDDDDLCIVLERVFELGIDAKRCLIGRCSEEYLYPPSIT